jgi:hypothetical protein
MPQHEADQLRRMGSGGRYWSAAYRQAFPDGRVPNAFAERPRSLRDAAPDRTPSAPGTNRHPLANWNFKFGNLDVAESEMCRES